MLFVFNCFENILQGSAIGAPKGSYTVKEGYARLVTQSKEGRGPGQMVWIVLGAIKEVLLKVRLFLWRACNEGLSTTMAMSRRIRTISRRVADVGKKMNTSHIC
jgi:hypothetical protein